MEAWLKHLRNEFPTVAFKASTQTQKQNLVRMISIFHKIMEFDRFVGFFIVSEEA